MLGHAFACRLPGPATFSLLLILGLSRVQPAYAYYWELTPQFEAGITAESNPRFVDNGGDIQSAKGTYIDIRAIGALMFPDKSLTLTPRLISTNYLGSNQDLDSDDVFVDLVGSSQSTLGQLDVTVSYADQAVVSAEFEDATPDNPDLPPPTIGGSGRFADATQETWSGTASYTYNLSQRNVLAVSASGSTTTYDAEPSAGFFDYSSPSASITLQHVLNQRDVAFLSLNGGSFTAEAPVGSAKNTTDSFGATVGYQRQFSSTLSGTVIGGLSRSFLDITGLPIDPDTGALCFPTLCSISTNSRTFVGSINVRKRSEQTTMNLDISRNLAPNSNGTQYIQDAIRVFVDQDLTERLVGTLGLVFTNSSSVANIRRLDQNYFTANGILRYKLTPTWSLAGNYAFVLNNSDAGNSSSKETNNALFLSVSYSGVGMRW